MSEQWRVLQSQGYHGMQALALIEKQMMPDNDSRSLYGLCHYMAALLHSVNAYYMFQVLGVTRAHIHCKILRLSLSKPM